MMFGSPFLINVLPPFTDLADYVCSLGGTQKRGTQEFQALL
jgi:hypothetical protein